jgi:purine-binding chemotaxis protein CheW
MNELYLVLTIGRQRVAISATTVESVVEIDEIATVPLVAPHVAGLFALRSRVLTVIDTLASLQTTRTELSGTVPAVIVAIDGHGYALLVDSVEDVIAPPSAVAACPAALAAGWARCSLGVIEVDGDALLVLDPVALISGPLAVAA